MSSNCSEMAIVSGGALANPLPFTVILEISMLVIPFLNGSGSFSLSLALRKRFHKNQGLITKKTAVQDDCSVTHSDDAFV
jgi:hypothetical protein